MSAKENNDQIAVKIGPELKGVFDGFCAENGLSQKDAIKALLELAQTDALKNFAPGQADAIAEFARHQQALKDAFATSIRMGAEAKETARAELKLELERKDRTIDNYQQQVNDLKVRADQADELASKLEEQTKVNETLIADLTAANAKAAEYDSLMAEYNALKAEHDALKVANLEEQLAQFRQIVADATKPRTPNGTQGLESD